MYDIDNVKWYDGDHDPDPYTICATDTETAPGQARSFGEDDLLDPSSDLLVCGPCLRDASEGLWIQAA